MTQKNHKLIIFSAFESNKKTKLNFEGKNKKKVEKGESEVLLIEVKKLNKGKRETIFFVTFGLSYKGQSSYCCAHSFISTCFPFSFSLNPLLPLFF